MKLAGPAALDALEPLLARLRTLPGLKEKSRGIFYLKSKAFLHYHEDPAGLFADLREDSDFTRYEVTSAEGQEALFAATLRRLS